ncbi:hypothetical protein TNCV_1813731 [Trichonephila clavipes]|uniref:Uncharacterized protein n=1 Tax=Trichonephila clavipes TaxID=2585209 RepID=A0A8X6W7L3_TRICX|nr:hypothetical protein TNCV_466251 [Trichonephila clavipes]GFY29797.1 hypothetical protein TNCV_1813731 [Trichonephila clavipes]
MEGDSGRGELAISAVSEKIKSKFVQADEKLVCYWSSGVDVEKNGTEEASLSDSVFDKNGAGKSVIDFNLKRSID